MMTNGLIDPKPLKELLIQLKTEALENEARATGPMKALMSVRIKDLDAMLIYLSTEMREEHAMGLKLRLEEPIPTEVIKAKDKDAHELTLWLVENAKKVPVGQTSRIAGIEGKQARSVASKMWALRTTGVLPEYIVPMEKLNKETRLKEVHISHKTQEELAKMRKGRKSNKN